MHLLFDPGNKTRLMLQTRQKDFAVKPSYEDIQRKTGIRPPVANYAVLKLIRRP